MDQLDKRIIELHRTLDKKIQSKRGVANTQNKANKYLIL